MKINEIHHVAVNTRDFDKSIQFYTDVLKLELLEEADLGGDYAAYIKCGKNSVLELFKMDQRLKEDSSDDTKVGIRHIAFDVDHVGEWNHYLKQLEIPYRTELMEIEAIRKKVLLIDAPDNVIVELSEGY